MGDSLSAGFGLDLEESWVTMLQSRLDAKGYGYKVVNASISGDTTGNGLRRLPRALQIDQPEIVVIELGGNDGLRGIPIDIMQNNL
jgi:acyl-CoA thioesterase-1